MNLTHIVPDLHSLAVRCDSLIFMDNNPRTHDDRSFNAIRASVETFKQTKPIVLASDGKTVLAGNGTLETARRLGWEYIAASRSELVAGSAEAMAYAIADNRTTDLSYFDLGIVEQAMSVLDKTLRDATGFIDDIFEVESRGTGEEAEAATQSVSILTNSGSQETECVQLPSITESKDSGEAGNTLEVNTTSPKQEPAPRIASIRYDLTFSNDDEQQEFFEFTRWLQEKYPDIETIGGRIAEWLRTEAQWRN